MKITSVNVQSRLATKSSCSVTRPFETFLDVITPLKVYNTFIIDLLVINVSLK